MQRQTRQDSTASDRIIAVVAVVIVALWGAMPGCKSFENGVSSAGDDVHRTISIGHDIKSIGHDIKNAVHEVVASDSGHLNKQDFPTSASGVGTSQSQNAGTQSAGVYSGNQTQSTAQTNSTAPPKETTKRTIRDSLQAMLDIVPNSRCQVLEEGFHEILGPYTGDNTLLKSAEIIPIIGGLLSCKEKSLDDVISAFSASTMDPWRDVESYRRATNGIFRHALIVNQGTIWAMMALNNHENVLPAFVRTDQQLLWASEFSSGFIDLSLLKPGAVKQHASVGQSKSAPSFLDDSKGQTDQSGPTFANLQWMPKKPMPYNHEGLDVIHWVDTLRLQYAYGMPTLNIDDIIQSIGASRNMQNLLLATDSQTVKTAQLGNNPYGFDFYFLSPKVITENSLMKIAYWLKLNGYSDEQVQALANSFELLKKSRALKWINNGIEGVTFKMKAVETSVPKRTLDLLSTTTLEQANVKFKLLAGAMTSVKPHDGLMFRVSELVAKHLLELDATKDQVMRDLKLLNHNQYKDNTIYVSAIAAAELAKAGKASDAEELLSDLYTKLPDQSPPLDLFMPMIVAEANLQHTERCDSLCKELFESKLKDHVNSYSTFFFNSENESLVNVVIPYGLSDKAAFKTLWTDYMDLLSTAIQQSQDKPSTTPAHDLDHAYRNTMRMLAYLASAIAQESDTVIMPGAGPRLFGAGWKHSAEYPAQHAPTHSLSGENDNE